MKKRKAKDQNTKITKKPVFNPLRKVVGVPLQKGKTHIYDEDFENVCRQGREVGGCVFLVRACVRACVRAPSLVVSLSAGLPG